MRRFADCGMTVKLEYRVMVSYSILENDKKFGHHKKENLLIENCAVYVFLVQSATPLQFRSIDIRTTENSSTELKLVYLICPFTHIIYCQIQHPGYFHNTFVNMRMKCIRSQIQIR